MSEEIKTNEPVKQEGDFKVKKKRIPKKLSVPEETVKIDQNLFENSVVAQLLISSMLVLFSKVIF